ncbi:MAG: hypothetical protein ACOC56_04860 [Atribacterota bacterium]
MENRYNEPNPQEFRETPDSVGNIPAYTEEENIKNIVGQIDPSHILDNLNHALKGEYYNKEQGRWVKVGDPLVNNACRGWIITYFTSIMNNASTMGIISEKQFSFFMEGVIKTVTREFRCNLEKFGFVPPGPRYKEGLYENKGSPDTSRMNSIAEMIYQRAAIIYSRSIKGTESSRILRRLNLPGDAGYGPQPQKKGWFKNLLGN